MKETYKAILALLADGQPRQAVDVATCLNLSKQEAIRCLAVAAGAEKVVIEHLAGGKYYRLAPGKPRQNSAEKLVSLIVKKRKKPASIPPERWEEWRGYCEKCGVI